MYVIFPANQLGCNVNRNLLLVFLTVLFLFCLTKTSYSQNLQKNFDLQSRPLYQQGVITVKLKKRLSQRLAKSTNTFGLSSVDEKLSQLGATNISKRFVHKPIPENSELPDLSRIYKIELPENADIEQVIKELSNDPNVEYAEPIPVYYLLEVPDDSLYSIQSHLPQINAEKAWDIHKSENGEEPVIIGICDSGVKWDHPDLIDNIWQNLGEDADNDGHVIEWADSVWVLDPGDRNGIDDDGNGYPDDFIGWNGMGEYGEDPSNPIDKTGHGTHVAGIAAATTNNEIGIAGISWNAKIMIAKIGNGPYISDGPGGIIYLAEAGADIINCSWGGRIHSHANEEAVKYATMLGSIVVCSAGNDGLLGIHYPAKNPNVVAVGGVTSEDRKHYKSNCGAAIDVMAPYSVFSTSYTDDYVTMNGTSMSSPLVAGLLALMKSYFPGMSNDQLVERLKYTSDNIDHLNPYYENYLGTGRVNAYRALTDTTINIPELYRLDIRDISLSNDSEQSLEAGYEYRFNFAVLNFSDYYYYENVAFYLTSDDPDVEILKNSVSKDLFVNDVNGFFDAFLIRIKANARFHKAEFKITAYSEIPVTMCDFAFSFEIIPTSGIFIYDQSDDAPICSGAFFSSFFSEEEQIVSYSSDGVFPSSLKNFDAVFLSYGTPDYFSNFPSAAVEEYLEQGGKLYIESGGIFSQLTENKNILALMGLQNATFIGEPEFPLDSLYGNRNTIAEGIIFNKTDWHNVNSLEVYEPNIIGKTAFTDANYGTVAIQNEGLNGQKTFCLSYSMSNLHDIDQVNNRANLMSKVISFLDIPGKFNANFDTREQKGKPPFKVKFHDLSIPDSGRQIISRKWDFNNDGNINSEELYPEWTYNEPGVYTVKLEVNDGINRKTVTREDYITVFADDTALEFNGKEDDNGSLITVTADSILNIKSDFTLEAWIKPYDGILSSGNIMDKIYFNLQYNCNYQSIILRTIHEPFSFETFSYATVFNRTPLNSIVPGQWQHIAATYNAPQKEIKIYINGFEQSLNLDGEILDSLQDNAQVDLGIGNNTYLIKPSFHGAIDEIRIWNVARTNEQILEKMDNVLHGNEEGLVLYLPLNKGAGDEVNDYSVFNHTATMQNTKWIEGLSGIVTSTKSEIEENNLPDSYRLNQNYPNPFNPSTTISFVLPTAGKVTLEVFNILGQRVATLIDTEMKSGFHSIKFDAGYVASGVYFYRFHSGKYTQTKKLLLMK